MDKIASFTVDHEALEPGVYVSRVDRVGAEPVTTFDIRMTAPNDEPVMDTAAVHCLEHLGATYLRNDAEWGPRTVYFGPMGCRTGFYLVVAGNATPEDVVGVLGRMFAWAAAYEGEVPGASPHDCGNYLDINLPMARWEAKRFLDRCLSVIDEDHMRYPGTVGGL